MVIVYFPDKILLNNLINLLIFAFIKRSFGFNASIYIYLSYFAIKKNKIQFEIRRIIIANLANYTEL